MKRGDPTEAQSGVSPTGLIPKGGLHPFAELLPAELRVREVDAPAAAGEGDDVRPEVGLLLWGPDLACHCCSCGWVWGSIREGLLVCLNEGMGWVPGNIWDKNDEPKKWE